MPRYDVWDERGSEYIRGFVVDAPNADVARGIAAERYKRNPNQLFALLQHERSKTDSAVTFADAVYTALKECMVAHQKAQARHDRNAMRWLSTVYMLLQAAHVAAQCQSQVVDVEEHLRKLKEFEAKAIHPNMFIPDDASEE